MIDSKSIVELVARLEEGDAGTYSYVHLAFRNKWLEIKVFQAILDSYKGSDRVPFFATRVVAVHSLEEARLTLEAIPDVGDSIPSWAVCSTEPEFWDLFVNAGLGHKLHPPTISLIDPEYLVRNHKALKLEKFANLVGNQTSGHIFGDSLYSYPESAHLYILRAIKVEEYPPTFAARMCRLSEPEFKAMERAYRLYIREQSDEYKEQLADALESVSMQKGDNWWPSWLLGLLITPE